MGNDTRPKIQGDELLQLVFDRETVDALATCVRVLKGRLTCPAQGITPAVLRHFNEYLAPYGIECATLYGEPPLPELFQRQRVCFFERVR